MAHQAGCTTQQWLYGLCHKSLPQVDILSEEKSFLQGQSPIAQAGQYLGLHKGFVIVVAFWMGCAIMTKGFDLVTEHRNKPNLS